MISKRLSKFIKSLKIKKFRAREKSFIVEGKKNGLELLDSDYQILYVLATADFIQVNSSALSNVRNNLHEVTSSELQELGTFKTNNDCLAVGTIRSFEITDLKLDDHVFILDGLSDPGNLGTIIRTLDWFGFYQLVCSPDTAEFYNPKVLNATMGSFTRVKLFYEELRGFITSCKLPVVGADLQGQPLSQWAPTSPHLVVMGSESHGISDSVGDLIKEKVSISKRGSAESLNVAIATGILCNHLRS
jgi:TrmH family RNA methyltransferase